MRAPLYGCLWVVLSGSAAAQLIVPVSQERVVTGDVWIHGPQPQSDSVADMAPDFGPYSGAESVTLDNQLALASGGGIQDSYMTDTSIVASGNVYVNGESYDEAWTGQAVALSRAIVDFTLTAKATFTLTGEITAFDHADSILVLQGDVGPNIVNEHTLNGPGEYPIDISGTLDPGDYRLVVSSEGGAYGSGLEFDYGFAEYDMTFQLTALSSSYCVAAPNSVGAGAELALGGSQNISDDDFRIEATGAVPGGFGLVFYGPSQVQVPFGDGFRCVGGQTHRVQPPVQADQSGFVSKPICFTSGPASSGPGQIDADSTWNFQLWYRDPMGPGGNGFNVSDGLSVTFCP